MPETIKKTSIEGLLTIERPVFGDERGDFRELFNLDELKDFIKNDNLLIKQGNISHSKKGVIRGIHCEPMDKIVTAACGTAYCVYVDLRKDSPTYKKHEVIVLGDEIEGYDAKQVSVYIPQGIGNSLMALNYVSYVYSVEKTYIELQEAKKQAGNNFPHEINIFDKDLNIEWPKLDIDYIISDRDRKAPMLKDVIG